MSIIGFLYSLIGVIAIIGYTPQIITLWKSKTQSKDVSIPTWFVWLSTWIISLLYGIIELQDFKFSMIAVINIVGHLAILGLTFRNRLRHAS